MQLESTLFAVVVIQIKPQLERVLNLSQDSLTKEIKLTQDLMTLFVEYQIPVDLLSASSGSAEERVAAVRAHVDAIQRTIAEAKAEELAERRREEEAAQLEEEAERRRAEEARRMEELRQYRWSRG